MQDRWFRNKPPRICVVIGLQHYFIVQEHFRISGTGGTLPKVLNRYGWLDQLEKSCKKASVVLVLGVTEGQAILGTLCATGIHQLLKLKSIRCQWLLTGGVLARTLTSELLLKTAWCGRERDVPACPM
jgi:hypothetical protein